jgi:DNA polymerase-3 subunit delta
MPIHLFWGDDEAARNRAVEALINAKLDPTWAAINLSRLDGNDPVQAAQAVEEARTPPFGSGARVVVLQRSPFCNQCPAELAGQLDANLALVHPDCHLLLVSSGKPDARLRTTKALQQLVKEGLASEQSFALPPIWDGAGQVQLVTRTATDLGLTLEPAAAEALAEAIGSDSARLASELEKLNLYVSSPDVNRPVVNSPVVNSIEVSSIEVSSLGVSSLGVRSDTSNAAPITLEAVQALVGGRSTSALAVGDARLAGRPADAIALCDALLEANEPALRIVASLSSQIRGWLWVALLERSGERDPAVIAKAAGIGNPKRIYVMRKQIQGRSPDQMLKLLGQLLEVEAALKRGADPGEAFRDGFLLRV